MSQYLQYGSSIIASDSLAVGRVPVGARYQGTTLIDPWQPFRAEHAVVYGRGRGPREYTVTVQRFFASNALAKAFSLTHEDALPVQDDLTYVDDVAGLSLVMADAVCSVRMAPPVGAAVSVEYTFTGARFISGDVPDYPTDTESVKALLLDLTAGEESKAFTWDTAFSSVPRDVVPALRIPTGGSGFHVFLIGDVTAEGGTVGFSEPVPASPAGYKLSIGGRL